MGARSRSLLHALGLCTLWGILLCWERCAKRSPEITPVAPAIVGVVGIVQRKVIFQARVRIPCQRNARDHPARRKFDTPRLIEVDLHRVGFRKPWPCSYDVASFEISRQIGRDAITCDVCCDRWIIASDEVSPNRCSELSVA
jgi:hypothetical protein